MKTLTVVGVRSYEGGGIGLLLKESLGIDSPIIVDRVVPITQREAIELIVQLAGAVREGLPYTWPAAGLAADDESEEEEG